MIMIMYDPFFISVAKSYGGFPIKMRHGSNMTEEFLSILSLIEFALRLDLSIKYILFKSQILRVLSNVLILYRRCLPGIEMLILKSNFRDQ